MQKVNKKGRKLKKTQKDRKCWLLKRSEKLFMKVIHHYFAAALPVAHAPARG